MPNSVELGPDSASPHSTVDDGTPGPGGGRQGVYPAERSHLSKPWPGWARGGGKGRTQCPVPKARVSGTGQPRNAGDKTWGLSPNPPHVIALPTFQESLTTTNCRWWRARGRKHPLSLLPCPDSPSLCRRMCNSCKACWAVSCRPCSVSLLSAGPRTRWWPWPVPLTSSEEICESGWGGVEQEVS